MSFDMPGGGASFEERGGWVVRALANQFDLTLEQAAGIVGNLGFESMGFRVLQEMVPAVAGSRGGFGWAQWTGPRRRSFEAWCTTNSLKPSSDEANYGFLLAELKGAYRATIREVKKCETLPAAVFSVGQTYERPGGTTPSFLPGFDGRMRYAEQALAGTLDAFPVAPVAPSGPLVRSAVNRVKAIQEVLAEGKLYTRAIDGDWGDGSRAALDTLTRQAHTELKQ